MKFEGKCSVKEKVQGNYCDVMDNLFPFFKVAYLRGREKGMPAHNVSHLHPVETASHFRVKIQPPRGRPNEKYLPPFFQRKYVRICTTRTHNRIKQQNYTSLSPSIPQTTAKSNTADARTGL